MKPLTTQISPKVRIKKAVSFFFLIASIGLVPTGTQAADQPTTFEELGRILRSQEANAQKDSAQLRAYFACSGDSTDQELSSLPGQLDALRLNTHAFLDEIPEIKRRLDLEKNRLTVLEAHQLQLIQEARRGLERARTSNVAATASTEESLRTFERGLVTLQQKKAQIEAAVVRELTQQNNTLMGPMVSSINQARTLLSGPQSSRCIAQLHVSDAYQGRTVPSAISGMERNDLRTPSTSARAL